MSRKTPSHLGMKLIILSALGAVLLLWVCMDWPCGLRRVFGVPCISCGMSRAWLAVLRLDFGAAFFYHPMFWSIPLLILYAIFDGRLLKRRKWDTVLLGLILAGFVVCYALRLVGYLRGDIVF